MEQNGPVTLLNLIQWIHQNHAANTLIGINASIDTIDINGEGPGFLHYSLSMGPGTESRMWSGDCGRLQVKNATTEEILASEPDVKANFDLQLSEFSGHLRMNCQRKYIGFIQTACVDALFVWLQGQGIQPRREDVLTIRLGGKRPPHNNTYSGPRTFKRARLATPWVW